VARNFHHGSGALRKAGSSPISPALHGRREQLGMTIINGTVTAWLEAVPFPIFAGS
jgi:hypothetical protein